MSDKSIIIGAIRPDLLLDETLIDLFQSTVKKHPNKTALQFQNESYTYQELDHWSSYFAHALTQKGIGKGDKVGMWWKRGAELHVAIIAILKAGAGYVPLDREMPADRVALVMNEVGAKAYISDEDLSLNCQWISTVQKPQDLNAEFDFTSLAEPDNDAYVLYTSGSTGKPKGIAITHRNICHLVRSEQTVINIKESDKVYQGFSVSFDMWCEETWVSYFAGATLWVADSTTAKSLDELHEVLRDQQITVLHAVPSLLAVLENEVPTLRLINAGGEACTPLVVEKWAIDNRQFFNSYGPTETTVSSSFAPLKPKDIITIGQPLPNYNYAVVDEQMNPLPKGELGEMVISGPGLSRGYVGLPELTKEKFLPKPASLNEMPGDRIYRTGDAVIIQLDGTVDFQGRIDDQIKLRGYRIELGEIEAKLAQLPNVTAAAVVVKKDGNGQDQLAGYVILKSGSLMDEDAMRKQLATFLPPYMVPMAIVEMKEMPRMPSGKINRKALPLPDSFLIKNETALQFDETTSINDKVIGVLNQIFPNKNIEPTTDFFNDLGGHSLLAASFVSRLRKEAGMTKASLKDVYMQRPMSALIAHWEKTNTTTQAAPKAAFTPISNARYWKCWLAQTISLFFIYGLFVVQIFFPYLGYYYVKEEYNSLSLGVSTALLMYCLLPPLFTFFGILVKKVVIGKYKEGDYPLWGNYYFRWWLVNTIQELTPVHFLNGTPLFPMYLRLLGVKVAKDAQLSAFSIGAEDLVTIGSDVTISSSVILNNAWVENGLLKIRSIHIGDHGYLGTSAVVAGNTRIEEWGELGDLSYLPSESTIKKGEIWKGSPAQLDSVKDFQTLPRPLNINSVRRNYYTLRFSLSLLFFPFIVLLPLIPIIYTINWLDNNAADYNFTYLLFTPVLAIIYILSFTAETIILARWLQRKIKPGVYPIYSYYYFRLWFADQLMALNLIVLHPIYASVYVRSFFRALGAKVGKNTEISTASSVTHPLFEIGEGSFIADAVVLGEMDVRQQQFHLVKTTIGNGTFVGNSAVVPQGCQLPNNMLIGVLSVPPEKEILDQPKPQDFFGSPPMALPKRQESQAYPIELTVTPKPARRLARSIVETLRIILPQTVIFSLSTLFIAYAHDLITEGSIVEIIFQLPLYYICFLGIPTLIIAVLLKWLLAGKYKAEQHPMWTAPVWLSEAVTTTYEALTVPFLLNFMKGTAWLPLVMRLFGVKTGKKVWLNTTDITEHDMVSIGDESELNQDCGPQTHLFEDRVMKIGKVEMGKRVSIGARSIILYDTVIGDNVNIAPLSLVMKGENLAPSTSWTGSPVQPN